MENTKNNSRNRDYRDIQLEYVTNGLAAIKARFASNEVSHASIERASAALMANPSIDASDLNAWVNSLTPAYTGNGPGRGALEAGDIRNYKVQDVKGCFLRVPTPDLIKGYSVPIELSADGTHYIVHLNRAIAPAPQVMVKNSDESF